MPMRMSFPSRVALPVIALTIVALLLRAPFLPHESGDYVLHISPWYDHIRDNGLGPTVSTDVSDYTPPYLYVLGLATAIPLPELFTIKILSIVFDFALAAAVALLVLPVVGRRRALAAYALVLFAPTVILNSASWAQCDAIYAFFVVLGVALLDRDRPLWAVLATGVALAIKLQTVFILPLFALFTLRRRLPIWAWAALPVPYLIAVVPAVLWGRSLSGALLIYKSQSDTYRQLSLDGPSFYAWVTGREDFGRYAAIIGIAIVGIVVLACWRSRLRLTTPATIACATMFTLLVPYVLPRMHDRYFFLADVFSIAYAVTNPRRWFVPVLVITASLFSYLPFLYGVKPVPISWLSLLILAALITTLHDVFEPYWRRPAPSQQPAPSAATEAAEARPQSSP